MSTILFIFIRRCEHVVAQFLITIFEIKNMVDFPSSMEDGKFYANSD